MAVDDVNNSSRLMAGGKYQLHLIINDDKCQADLAMYRFIDMLKKSSFSSTVGILGPACSNSVRPIVGISQLFKTVVVTYRAMGVVTDQDRDKYTYFFRTVSTNKQNKFAWKEFISKLGWRKVAALTPDGDRYGDYVSELAHTLEERGSGIDFLVNRKFREGASDLTLYLEDLKTRGARIILGEFYPGTALHVMCTALRLGMTQKEGYVWLLPGWFQKDWYDLDKHRVNKQNKGEKEGIFSDNEDNVFMGDDKEIGDLPQNCSTLDIITALNGYFALVHQKYAADSDLLETGSSVGHWKSRLASELGRMGKRYEAKFQTSSTSIQASSYSGYVYDAVWVFAKALDKLAQEDETFLQNMHSNRSIEAFVRIIKDLDFRGVSGRINFVNRSSRLSDINIVQWVRPDLNSTKLSAVQVGTYTPDYSSFSDLRTDSFTMDSDEIRWQTADGTIPQDTEEHDCGLLSGLSHVLGNCEQAITVSFFLGFLIILLASSASFYMIKIKYDDKMKETENKMKALGLFDPLKALSLDEWEVEREAVVTNRKLGEGAFGMVYGGEASLKKWGQVAVAVKTLKEGSSIDQKIDFLSEAEMMKRFEHPNVVQLIGVCTKHEPVWTVMEYMLYGDLKTYLLARRHLVNESDREERDEVSNRRLTCMAVDIAQGLAYLSEQKYVHRDIACRNCLVNAQRTVKLADFGMARQVQDSDYYRFSRKGMLPVRWMAPESLADGLFTPSSDIWSYGVILYEIITFGSFPFQGLSNNQVLEHVTSGHTLLPPPGIRSQLTSLLQSCWNQIPTKRPTAAEVAELLSNNPQLVTPCVDVPLASVQMERTDSLDLHLPQLAGLGDPLGWGATRQGARSSYFPMAAMLAEEEWNPQAEVGLEDHSYLLLSSLATTQNRNNNNVI